MPQAAVTSAYPYWHQRGFSERNPFPVARVIDGGCVRVALVPARPDSYGRAVDFGSPRHGEGPDGLPMLRSAFRFPRRNTGNIMMFLPRLSRACVLSMLFALDSRFRVVRTALGRHERPVRGEASSTIKSTFQNPLKIDGADPWVIVHDGWYYLSTTTASDIRLQRARRLGDLKDAPSQVVWRGTPGPIPRYLGPGIPRKLDGEDGLRWYLYYTASDGDDTHHRLYAAESRGDDPLGPYTFKAKLNTDPDDRYYAIDGTILKVDGTLYFLWCGRPSTTGQGLYISKMANPWTLTGPRVVLPADGFGCAVGPRRTGDPATQRPDFPGLLHLSCGYPDYKLGMLIADAKANLMDPASWKQHPTPVFERDDAEGSSARATTPSSSHPTARKTGSSITPSRALARPTPIVPPERNRFRMEPGRDAELWPTAPLEPQRSRRLRVRLLQNNAGVQEPKVRFCLL